MRLFLCKYSHFFNLLILMPYLDMKRQAKSAQLDNIKVWILNGVSFQYTAPQSCCIGIVTHF